MPSKPKKERRQLNWERVSYHTSEDGNGWMVERYTSYTLEAHRFTVRLDRGSVSGKQRAFLDMLYRTFSDTPEQPT